MKVSQMSRNRGNDDRIDDDSIETQDFFDDSDARKSRSDDSDDDSRSDDSDDESRSDDSTDSITGMRRGRGRGRGRGRSSDDSSRSNSDDDSNSSDNSDDSITGRRTRQLGGSKKGYQFEADDEGNVTSLTRVKRGRTKREKIEAGESWTYDSENMELIHREFGALGTEVTIYKDSNQDGIFTRSFKNFESAAAFGVETL